MGKCTNEFQNCENKVDKLNFDKLVPPPVDLSKLSDVVKNDLVKKNVYNAKIKNIENKIAGFTNLVTTTALNAKTDEAKNKISNITNLATTATRKAKISELKNKIPNITNLATTTGLTAVEYKIPTVSN